MAAYSDTTKLNLTQFSLHSRFIGVFNLAIYPNQVLQFWDNVVV